MRISPIIIDPILLVSFPIGTISEGKINNPPKRLGPVYVLLNRPTINIITPNTAKVIAIPNKVDPDKFAIAILTHLLFFNDKYWMFD